MKGEQIVTRPRWVEFAGAYVVTMRPYLLFVSGITGIAGLSLVEEIEPVRFLLVAAASFLSYGFGQALTDCFQIDTDSLSSPYRPLTRGVISRPAVLVTSLAGLAACISVFGEYHRFNLALGFLGAAGLATYTPMKRRWYAGPMYNAGIVVAVCLMAFLAGGGRLSADPAALGVFGTVLFGYANFVLSGYFKDIAADRATGYRTLPVVFGRTLAARASDALALLAVLCAVAAVAASLAPPESVALGALLPPAAGILFLLGGIGSTVVGQARLHEITEDSTAHRAISPVVHGYILMLSGIAAVRHPSWAAALALFYCAYRIVLASRPARDQI